jgi:GT2 family glycosyltransferase
MSLFPSVAIVILNWNGISLFSRFLPSVIENSRMEGVSLYIADNGSTDGSIDFLKMNFPEVKIIALGKNYGFAGGYNRALQKIEADIYVLLNSDIEVTGNWLQPCIRQLLSEPDTAALQPKIRSFLDRSKFEYAGAAGGYLDHWGYPFCRGRILSEVEIDIGQYDQNVSLFWATGACLFIKSSVFKASGGFDEDFFAHMEEIDLCWRLKNQGWKIGFEPTSVVYHLGGATLNYQSPQKVFLNFRNSLWMMVKNLPEGKLCQIMFPRMLLDGAAALNFLVTGQFFAFMAVLKAHFSFYQTLRKFLRKRKMLMPLVRQNKHPQIFRGSMVVGFYMMKRRKFSQFSFRDI